MTGPNLPQADYDAALAQAPAGLDVFRFRKDFPSLLAAAELSVSQAGYNTVCDVLQAGCRAILVPFAAGGETEQTVRAERLQRLGLAVAHRRDGAFAGTCSARRSSASWQRRSRLRMRWIWTGRENPRCCCGD